MGPIGRGSTLNFDTNSRRLAIKRRTANKRGKVETVSTSGARFTSRPRIATWITELGTITRPTAGAPIAPIIHATLPPSMYMTTLRVVAPSARASRSPQWKLLRRRTGSGRSASWMNQSPRLDTRPLETYIRTSAGCSEPSTASPVGKLEARPPWSRKGQS